MSQEIYVKEMPKSCGDCPCEQDYFCGITMKDVYYEHFDYTKPTNCPLKSLHELKKELVAKVLEEVENAFTEYLPLKNRTGAWFYGRLNEILKKYQKEFEDGK